MNRDVPRPRTRARIRRPSRPVVTVLLSFFVLTSLLPVRTTLAQGEDGGLTIAMCSAQGTRIVLAPAPLREASLKPERGPGDHQETNETDVTPCLVCSRNADSGPVVPWAAAADVDAPVGRSLRHLPRRSVALTRPRFRLSEPRAPPVLL